MFRALADPVRWELVQRLVSLHQPTISEISSEFGITRQGVRKHLEVLAKAEIVSLEPRGREVFIQLRPDQLRDAHLALVDIERQWERRLNALKLFVESTVASEDSEAHQSANDSISLSSSELAE